MADFRKHALAFAGVACFLGVTGSASAQSFVGFSCTANAATPFQMRAEGITEQAGDVLLNCTGGTATPAASPVPQVNITVSLNTQVTSRLLVSGTGQTDALLLINDPAPGAQVLCPTSATGCPFLGTGRGGGAGQGQYATNNVYQGILTAANQLTFFGVPVDPAGAAVAGVSPILTFRITNIRANASALGAPSGFSSTSVTGFISTSAGFQINNPSLTVGSIFTGLLQGIVSGGVVVTPAVSGVSSTSPFGPSGGPPVLTQCTSRSANNIEFVNFTEGFGTATKLRVPLTGIAQSSIPGNFQNSESQFIPNFLIGGQGTSPTYGYADFATRIKIVFGNVPAGVTLYVPISVSNNGAFSETLNLTASETGPFAAVASTTTISGLAYAPVTLVNGAGTVVYETVIQTSNSATSVENFSVGVAASYTASPGTGSPGLGTSTVQVAFAPSSTVQVASAGPIPRFITTTPNNNGFAVSTCATNLLFPFVTNQAGFDTGIAIASTSSDPFGTTIQGGTCTLNFYGAGAPAAFVSPNVAGGTVYTTLASSIAAGFQGYVIAQCRFQYAHGFAFVTDGFGGPGRGLSQGYLPLIIPDTSIVPRGPNPNVILMGAGEILSN